MLTKLAQADTLGTLVACALTLLILFGLVSRKVSHFTQHILVGVTAGYVGAIIWQQVLITRLALFFQQPIEYWYYGLFFIIGLALFIRTMPRLSGLSRIPLVLLLGVGAGLALGGTLAGTLLPQTAATIKSLAPNAYGSGLSGASYALDAVIMILCTVSSLIAFRYITFREKGFPKVLERLSNGLSTIGRAVIAIVLGALLSGAVITFYTLLLGRIDFLTIHIPLIIEQVGL